MNFLQSYASDDDDSVNNQQPKPSPSSNSAITAAPNVILSDKKQYILPKDSTSLVFNPKYDELYAPKVGPKNPFATSNTKFDSGFMLNGEINSHNMNTYLFNSQYYNYDVSRQSNLLPGGSIGNGTGSNASSASIQGSIPSNKKNRKRKQDQQIVSDSSTANNGNEKYIELNENEDAEIIAAFGEDSFIEDDTAEEHHEQMINEIKNQHEEQMARRKEQIKALKEQQQSEEQDKKKKKEDFGKIPEISFDEETEKKTTTEGKEGYSIYHLSTDVDYQGRSFISPPSHLKPCEYTEKKSVLPKKCIHTYRGHQEDKMVTSIEFFPNYGHLLLSGSMDCTVKIWDVLGNRNCVRTYVGHSKAVRSASFSHDGSHFASCAYDKRINIWDTETGTVLQTFTSGSTPYCVKWSPLEGRQHEIVVGYSNNRIIQWDTRSGKIARKYDRHTGSVNSLCFLDGGKKFVSSSDDKSIRLWEYGVPAEIKKIADPEQHPMPFLESHPNGKWMIAQSLDNQILTFDAQSRLKQQQNKVFKGHQIAGYSCQVGFSNDGKFVFSGDYTGNVWFWDWKEAKQIKKMQCHEGICIGCIWHPIDRSIFATCGSDGTIKVFQ